MNSKKVKAIRKEARKFSNLSGMNYNEVYKQMKETSKGLPLKSK